MHFKRLLLLLMVSLVVACSDSDEDSSYLYMPTLDQPKEQKESTNITSDEAEQTDMRAVALSLAETDEEAVQHSSVQTLPASTPKPVAKAVVEEKAAPAKVVTPPKPQKVTPPVKKYEAKQAAPVKPVEVAKVETKPVVKPKKVPEPKVDKKPVSKPKPEKVKPVKVVKKVEPLKVATLPVVKAQPEKKVASVVVDNQSGAIELAVLKHDPLVERDAVYSYFERDRFQKLGARGGPLGDDAKQWACVKDRKTHQVWEAKTEGKLRNKKHTYLFEGVGGSCSDESCLVSNYIDQLNSQKLCGKSDWRLPSRNELLKLVYFERPEGMPAIDTRFFINTQKGRYWSSTKFKYGAGRMITVDFESGYDKSHPKEDPAHIRLISGR